MLLRNYLIPWRHLSASLVLLALWKFWSGLCLNIKTVFPIYGISIIKIRKLSYLYNWDSNTAKTTSLYWDGTLVLYQPHNAKHFFAMIDIGNSHNFHIRKSIFWYQKLCFDVRNYILISVILIFLWYQKIKFLILAFKKSPIWCFTEYFDWTGSVSWALMTRGPIQ